MTTLLLALLASLAHASPAPQALTATARFRPTMPGGGIDGQARLRETPEGVELTANLAGLPPGEHGFHVHENGSCEEAGLAAGEHFNPLGSPHGLLIRDGEAGAHAGDMGSITAGRDGIARVKFMLPKATLAKGPMSVGGRALIVHENPDDFSQPSGNAGKRIACGVIVVAE